MVNIRLPPGQSWPQKTGPSVTEPSPYPNDRRRFSNAERAALYLAADGTCNAAAYRSNPAGMEIT